MFESARTWNPPPLTVVSASDTLVVVAEEALTDGRAIRTADALGVGVRETGRTDITEEENAASMSARDDLLVVVCEESTLHRDECE
jgi:hypothetical protein